MNRFPSEWLALREPVDLASHNKDVLNACAQTFANRDKLSVCDLGAGTGAAVRAFAPILPKKQRWTLVDYDAENLGVALEALAAWNGTVTTFRGGCVFERAGRRIEVQTKVYDLAAAPARWSGNVELVTASALFDLTSSDWIARLVDALCAKRLTLLAVLSFDGLMEAKPEHELDRRIFAAFRAHQHTDKGFGPASGPDAATVLENALSNAGYAVTSGDSPWKMNCNTRRLMQETLKGIAAAAAETAEITRRDAEQWLADRIAGTESLIVGHRDIFATPDSKSFSAEPQ